MKEEEKKSGDGFPSIITREGHSVGKTESFNRSNHEDFATSSELKQRKFSGIRNNELASRREIWMDGDMVASLDSRIAESIPGAWDKLYAETFALGEVQSI